MSGNFQKKTTNVFLTIFIGFIVISFMFTGYETMRGTPDTVAVVDDQSISFREYQNEYNRQISMFSNYIKGGQALTSKEIQDFKIKENTLKSLVNNRLTTVLGEKLGVVATVGEIRQAIKMNEDFLTNGSFDLEKYKAILRANQLTPIDFESLMERGIVSSRSSALLNYPVSKNFIADIEGFKQQKRKATIVRLSKDDVAGLMKVSSDDVKGFLAEETNLERVKSIFNERKSTLDKEETVNARHLLVTPKENESDAKLKARIDKIAKETTAKNFLTMVKKYTEEPGGKESGGSLGNFGRGRMVPEFEEAAFSLPVGQVSKPVKTNFGYHLILVESKEAAKEATLSNYQNEIASELIRKQKTEEVAAYIEKIAAEIEQGLNKLSNDQLRTLASRYKLNLETDVEINRYEGVKGKIFLETDQLNKVFDHKNESALDRFETASYITFVKSSPAAATKKTTKENESQEANTMRLAYSNKMRQEMLTKLGDEVTVRVHDNRIP